MAIPNMLPYARVAANDPCTPSLDTMARTLRLTPRSPESMVSMG